MELFLCVVSSVALFGLGLALGGIFENNRINRQYRVEDNLKKTQEILLPLANKIEHIDARCEYLVNITPVDYTLQDPEKTM